MSKAKDFDNILDECLERMLAGGETVEQCLAAYPEHAEELAPLLRTALGAKAAMDITPSAEFRERAAHRFQAALRDMETEKSRGFFGWQPRWAMSLAAVAVVLVAGGGTVAASAGSLPDEPLYPVKLATETVRLALTPSEIGKAELYVKLADERVAEIIEMAAEGKVDYIESTTQRLDGQLVAMSNNLGIPDGDMVGQAASVPEAAPRMMTVEEAPAALTAPVAEPAPLAPEAASEAAPPPAPAPALAPAVTEPAPAPEPAPVEKHVELNVPEIVIPPQAGPGREQAGSKPASGQDTDAPADAAPETPLPDSEPTQAPPPAEAPANGMPRVIVPEITIPDIVVPPATAYGEPDDQGELSAEEALKLIISQRAMQNTEALQTILDRVPEEARPALLQALEVAHNGYARALWNLNK